VSKVLAPQLTSRDKWLEVFPVNEAQRAAEFVFKTWGELSIKAPKTFNSSQRENHITEHLGRYLRNGSLTKARLLGWWTYEEPDGDSVIVDGELKAQGRIRKDIVYKSNSTSNKRSARIELIFEFKKLENTPNSCKIYRGKDGMRRFVDGNYAKGLPLALMVGMVIGDQNACLQGLRRSLLSTASKSDLRMVGDASGALLRDPSKVFPGVAYFDTEHNRPAGNAPTHGTMLLSHMFVPLPAPHTSEIISKNGDPDFDVGEGLKLT